MEPNPYEQPKASIAAKSNRRSRWKKICLASLCMAVIFKGIGLLLAASAKGSSHAPWFLILDGLVAFGELASWTMAGIGGIGGLLSRRKPIVEEPGQPPDLAT